MAHTIEKPMVRDFVKLIHFCFFMYTFSKNSRKLKIHLPRPPLLPFTNEIEFIAILMKM